MKSGRPVFTLTNIAFLILSLGYLVAEFVFNVRLLDIAGSVTAVPQDVENIADFGRSVSGCGFTLLTLGVFSRVDFKLPPVYRRAFYVFAAVCVTPMLFLQEGRQEIYYAFIPLSGVFIMSASRGRFALHTVLAIILVAWPSMYLGQKILINTFVGHTTWQERQQARNILMLRSGIEDCIVELQGLWLCEGDKASVEMRAVRAMVTTLWMHDPARTMADIAPQRNRIIENTALHGGWFSPREQYRKYVKAAGEKRSEIQQELVDKYYAPYKKASDMYLSTLDSLALRQQADEAWTEIDQKTEQAWKKYLGAVSSYHGQTRNLSFESLQRAAPLLQRMDEFCDRHYCPGGGAENMLGRLQDRAESKFIDETGLPPNIASKQEFMSYPKPRAEMEKQLSAQIQQRLGLAGFALPADWVYDESYIKAVIVNQVRAQAVTAWQKKFGKDLAPGLEADAFFSFYKMPPLPEVDKLVMSEEEFTRTMALPRSRELVEKMLADMEKEAPLYANGESLAQKGKDYILMVYIPSIALVLSLTIVLITVLRGINAALKVALQGRTRVWGMKARQARLTAIGLFITLVIVLPYALPNGYTSSPVYKTYVSRARRVNVVTASMLDWAIHMQPLIYTFSGRIKP